MVKIGIWGNKDDLVSHDIVAPQTAKQQFYH